jgi:hypothetical protein
MWTLWIVSSVIGSTEPKYTQYETFETAMSCHIEQAVLEATFENNEVAICTEQRNFK